MCRALGRTTGVLGGIRTSLLSRVWSDGSDDCCFTAEAFCPVAGYFTVFINFHGSTGYGQDFTESIHSPKSDWGGKPYRDLVAGLQYVLDEHPEIDRERLAALGASYGGYMINWLQGHNDLTRFKVFVCHDGVFGERRCGRVARRSADWIVVDLFGMYYSTEQVYFSEKCVVSTLPGIA